MQSITTFKPLNLTPTIVISHEGMEAIKHIVSIAPQEAQWFHTVQPIEYKSSPGEVFLHLSTKLYIPKQNTSAAQVDSTSSMMIEFYNELKTEYSSQEEVNSKLNSMTCWCHSHHNMSPNPSSQDDLQFNSFIQSCLDQKQQNWQVMLIFNKKNQFYSRVWDPFTGLILEGVDIQVSKSHYDFSYINQAAETKFIKPKLKQLAKKQTSFFNSSPFYYDQQVSYLQEEEDLNSQMATKILQDSFGFDYSNFLSKPRSFSSSISDIPLFYQKIIQNLDDQETLWLSFILSNKFDKLPNLWTEKQSDAYIQRYSHLIDERIMNYLNTTEDTFQDLETKLSMVFALTDAVTKTDLIKTIKKYEAIL